MAGAALQKHKDYGLGFSPSVLLLGRFGGRVRSRLQRQNVRKADPEDSCTAHSQEFASTEAIARAARLTRYRYHICSLYRLNRNAGLFSRAHPRSWAISSREPPFEEKSIAAASFSEGNRLKH